MQGNMPTIDRIVNGIAHGKNKNMNNKHKKSLTRRCQPRQERVSIVRRSGPRDYILPQAAQPIKLKISKVGGASSISRHDKAASYFL